MTGDKGVRYVRINQEDARTHRPGARRNVLFSLTVINMYESSFLETVHSTEFRRENVPDVAIPRTIEVYGC